MFKVVKNLSAWWPVSVLEPDENNPGALVERQFQAKFVIRSRDEAKALHEQRAALMKQLPSSDQYLADYDAAKAKADEINAALEAHDRKMFHLNIVDLKDIIGERDEPLAFSSDTLDMLLNLDRVRVGLVRAFDDAVSNDKARLGNSKA